MINNANPYFSNFLFPGAGIFLGALHHIFLFAVGSQSCFLLFPAELFPLIWGILVGQKVFFIQYCALMRNTYLLQKIRIVPYQCPLFVISPHSIFLIKCMKLLKFGIYFLNIQDIPYIIYERNLSLYNFFSIFQSCCEIF